MFATIKTGRKHNRVRVGEQTTVEWPQMISPEGRERLGID
jgi:hypothetical protein